MDVGEKIEPRLLTKLDHRIPRWDSREMHARGCPFCNTVDPTRYVRPDGVKISACSVCGALYASPAPTIQSLDRFYGEYYCSHFRVSAPDPQVILKLDPYSDFRIREIAANHLLHGSRVLDVGCGRGQVLAMFRQLGALVSGIDLDPSAVEFCRDALGIQDVCHGSFADLGGDRKYDIILMLDFIEHPIDPMASLESAASLLNDGGIIAIWTPNAAAARDSDDPVFMRVDLEHMQYLDFRTCHHIAGKLGLCVVHLEGVGHPSINDMLGTDLDKPVRSGCSASVRRLVRKIPGCSRLRRMLKGRHSSESSLSDRLGNYHLFCIMRRGT